MSSSRVGSVAGLAILSALIVLAPYGVRAADKKGAQPAVPPVEPTLKVLILRPSLSFERVENETPLAPEAYNGPAVEELLASVAKTVLESRGLATVDPSVLEPRGGLTLFQELGAMTRNLIRNPMPADTLASLERVRDLDENLTLLVQVAKVKVGPSRSWDPNTGAITSGMNTTRLQAGLVHCPSGRLVWRNEALLRDLPKLGTPKLADTLRTVYQTLSVRKE